MKRALSILFVLCTCATLHAQLFFIRNDSIPVNIAGTPLLFPWAGGMNYCQYSEIDLNMDGIQDLFVFDRTGNRILTFINHGTANTEDYTLDESYASNFPLIHDWALLRDYNCDGKADIFTSTGNSAAINVWKNISTVANGLQFQFAGPLLTEYTPNTNSSTDSLWVTYIDIPAIRDVDHDGDLDVLTYDVAGVNVEFHRNYSEETYGVCDSLYFKLESKCWGEFAENTLNATITVNDSCGPPGLHTHNDFNNAVAHNIHNGSTLECINTDGDGDQDILIGDITNPHVVYGRNANDSAFAKMDIVDPTYPSYNTPIDMNVFLGAFHLDVDNDGKKDVLFSPDALNSENFHSSYLYKNTGANDSVVVSFIENDFLQKDMIECGEGAYPRFFDYDNDGDQDLFIGDYGYYATTAYPAKISLYENQGSASAPSFKLITRDFADLFANTTNIFNPVPTFGDLDGDGDEDMIVGDVIGKLYYYRKDPGPANNFVLVTANYMGIDVGNFATPQLVDVDRDGKLDLLIGEQSGNINYFRNIGSVAVPNFALINPLFGNVIVNQAQYITGYSTPFLWDSAGTYVLFSGSERGFLFRYDNIDGNLSGTFTLTDSLYVSAREGLRTCPWMADITNDGLPDLVYGNFAGGVSLFIGNIMTGWNEMQLTEDAIGLYPNPSNGSFTLQTDLDPKVFPLTVSVFDVNGKLVLSRKMNSSLENFTLKSADAGLYICTIETKNGIFVRKKLIVEGL